MGSPFLGKAKDYRLNDSPMDLKLGELGKAAWIPATTNQLHGFIGVESGSGKFQASHELRIFFLVSLPSGND